MEKVKITGRQVLLLTVNYFLYIALSVVCCSTEILAVAASSADVNLSFTVVSACQPRSSCLTFSLLISTTSVHSWNRTLLHLKSVEQCSLFLMEHDSETLYLLYFDSTFLLCSYQQNITCGKFPQFNAS